jgi:RNA recognition motif-containing protein
MSSTVFLGNLPTWVTADDVKQWLVADNLVADSVKVIRNPETQESKGFAFIEAPNDEEMNLIIRRFDRAPLEERLLRANPAQPPRPKGAAVRPTGAAPAGASVGAGPASAVASAGAPVMADRNRRGGKKHRKASNGPQSAFAEELAKAL